MFRISPHVTIKATGNDNNRTSCSEPLRKEKMMSKISISPTNDYCPQTLFLYGTYDDEGNVTEVRELGFVIIHSDRRAGYVL